MLITVKRLHIRFPLRQIAEGSVEKGLQLLLMLPPNSINNTQRLEVLNKAFDKQSTIGVTASFVQVAFTYTLMTLHVDE